MVSYGEKRDMRKMGTGEKRGHEKDGDIRKMGK